jgi:hypothetical protein
MLLPPGPLTCATEAYDFKMVKLLLESGYASNTQSSVADNTVDAMRAAVGKDYLLIVDLFLASGIRPTGWDFITAVKQRSYPILELLLLNGYDINEAVRDDWPPPLA